MLKKTITSPRGNVYYKILRSSNKDAKVIFFLLGLTANHHLFDFQMEYFSKKYTVLVWDAPAHGQSRPYKNYSYSNFSEDLKAILENEKIKKIILVAQSAGEFTAQSFMAKYPDKVWGMVLIGSSPYGKQYYTKSDLFWLRQTKWTVKLFPDKMLRNITARLCGKTKITRKNMLIMLDDYNKKELRQLISLGFVSLIPEIREIKMSCPTCLIIGKQDETGKVKKYNKMWHECEGHPLHIIKNARHNANVDQVNEVNGIIEDFIAQIF